MRDKITRILYNNSYDGGMGMIIDFNKIEFVIDELYKLHGIGPEELFSADIKEAVFQYKEDCPHSDIEEIQGGKAYKCKRCFRTWGVE